MKTRLVIATLALIAPALPAREFTDLQGRKLEAEVVSAGAGQVTLKRSSDNRSFSVPVTTFTEADQKFISEWADQNTKYSFEVTYTKKKVKEMKTKNGPVTSEDEVWVYKINVRNRLPTPVSDLRLDYWCFRREDGGKGKGTARIECSGSGKIASMTGSGSTTLDSSEIILHKEKLDGGYYWTNGDKNNQADSVGGLAVRIFDKNGREVHKFATKDDLLVAAVGRPMAGGSNSDKNSSPK